MSSTIALSADQRKALLRLYRHPTRPEAAHRAHILLLLDQGYSWDAIAAVLFTSASTIARWQRRFLAGGLGARRSGGRRSRRRWPATSTPGAAAGGCGGASRRRSVRRGATRSATWRGR